MKRVRGALRWLTREGTIAVVAQTTLTRIGLLGINFATGVVIARFLGPSGRGALSALIILPPLMSALFSFGVPSALLYFARLAEKERLVLFTVAMLLTAGLSALMIAVGIAVVPYMLRHYDAATIRAAQWLMLLAPEIMLSSTLVAFMQSTNRFALFNQQRFIPGVMTLVALLLVKLYGNLSPLSAAVCYLAPPIPVLVYILWRMRDRIGISFVGARDAAARLLRYGARACGIDILGTVAQQADQVLVVGLLSATDMGLYAVALSISRVPSLIFTAMCDVISSKAIGLAPSALTDIVGRATRLTGFGGTLAAGALAALLPFALPLFYGTAFGAAVIITDILLLEMIAAGVASTLAIGFLATGHPGIVTLVRGGSLALVVPLLFILIPRFALVGAASALLISSVARIVAFVVLYRSTIGTPPPSLVVSPDDLRFIYRRLQADAALVSA